MKVIDLLNKIANGEVKDKEKFRIIYLGGLARKIYYDENEGCYLNCLKNVSDEYVIYDDITLNDEVEVLEEDKVVEVNVRPNLTYKFSADGLTITSVEEPKEIEEINMEWFKQVDMFDPKSVELAIEMMAKQINELVKTVNFIKKGN